MANQFQLYSAPSVFLNFEPAKEVTAVNVTETETLKTVTITSGILTTGLEHDPKFGVNHNITLWYGGSPYHYACDLIEKKVSGSVNKSMYQLLTFKITLEPELSQDVLTKMLVQTADYIYSVCS